MTETKETKNETPKLDLQALAELLSDTLHKKNQQMIINTETKTIGAFFPAAQAELIGGFQKKLSELEVRLSALESPRVPEEFQSVERAKKEDAPESKK